ncbi:MAG: metallophosphoesterase [Alistipes sp.]|nr:metallophosphoesterase [Alistipes sp.]
MKPIVTIVLAFALALFAPAVVSAQEAVAQSAEAYTINHGPYLQGLTYDGVIVCFTTSHNGFSKVELREKGADQVRECRTSKHGLLEANNTHNVIEINGLKPATEYEYRIVSKRVTRFDPYHVRFGEQVESEWYAFRTFDPAATEFSFVVANDIHDKADKLSTLLDVQPLAEAEMVFYNGDIMSYYAREGQPFKSFIDVSVEKFARHKPFAVVRGNHETRGPLARTYDDFIHNTRDGKYYGLYYFGDTAVVMLDCGEDKDDQHPVYAGLVDFDNYRLEQAEWLRGVVASKAFRKAKHRIVIMHIPPVTERMAEVEYNAAKVRDLLTWPGQVHLGKVILPILNDANIDVMLSGHLHQHMIFPVQSGVVEFPIVVNDNVSSMFVRVNAAGVNVKIVNTEGQTTFESTY